MQKSADALIMAAGTGNRFGSRKQFMDFGGRSVLSASCSVFENNDSIERVIAVYPPDMEEDEVRDLSGISQDIILVKGAVKRCDSVRAGLDRAEAEYVLIHDAARPACSAELVQKVLDTLFRHGAAVPAVNPVETVKYTDKGIMRTLDRNNVYLVQTPQGFRTSDIIQAYRNTQDPDPTDSSSVAQEYGMGIFLVEGERMNMKITVQSDYEYLLGALNREA